MLSLRPLTFLLLCSVSLFAQTPTNDTKKELNLKGGRFRPLTYEELSAEQKTLVDHTLANQNSLAGPTNIYLRSPVMSDLAQQMYTELRLRSPLPRKLHEFAVMLIAREWTVPFQWYIHSQIGRAHV